MKEISTPLSDCITQLAKNNSPETYLRFIQTFLASRVGIIVKGASTVVANGYETGREKLSAALGTTPDGRRMALACADRAVFLQRFNRPFNAEIDGISLLKMALADPQCSGIMINSAASEHTAVILREQIPQILAKT